MKVSIYTRTKSFLCKSIIDSKIDNVISLTMPSSIIESLNADVLAVLYDETYGLMTYNATIISYRKKISKGFKTSYTVRMVLGELIDIEQRRNNVKVKTNFTVTITMCDYEGNIQHGVDKKPVECAGTVRDMSAAGVFLIISEKFDVGQCFLFDFNKGSAPIRIQAEIIRVQNLEDSLTGYGCRFVDISSSKEAIVREYVFRKQLLERKTQKQMVDI